MDTLLNRMVISNVSMFIRSLLRRSRRANPRYSAVSPESMYSQTTLPHDGHCLPHLLTLIVARYCALHWPESMFFLVLAVPPLTGDSAIDSKLKEVKYRILAMLLNYISHSANLARQ